MRKKEIGSTEKLLDLIRSKKDYTLTEPADMPDTALPKEKSKFPSAKIISVSKTITVAVDIGHQYLMMVKTTQWGGNKRVLLDWKSVPLVHITSRKSPEFSNFLKSELSEFCGAYKNLNLWAIMSAARVNVRHIRIPKVAKKHMENAIYWMTKKEIPFDEKDTVFDYEVQGEITQQGIRKLSVMVYTAPKDEVEILKRQFNEIGLPLTGISISPFAIQNIFMGEWLPAVEGTVASLFIGNDFSRVDIYARGKLTMTRGIKAGINSMVESLLEKINESSLKSPEWEGEIRQIDIEDARKVLFSIGTDSPPLTEEDIGFELTEEEKFVIILPALERVIRQVERTFEHYTANLNYDRVDKIYVSSVMNTYMPIIEYVGNQLGIESDILDPFKLQLSSSGKGAPDIPLSERIAITPALGLALSDNEHTPNMLFRFKDKGKIANVARITRVTFAILVTVAFLCAGVFFYQFRTINQKKSTIVQLEERLLQYSPRVDRNLISQMVVSSKQLQQASKVYRERYLGMAIIGELSGLTQASIRLTDMKVYLGSIRHGTGVLKDAKKEETEKLVVEGVVFGNRKTLESSFADYIMKLETSPMFRQVGIQKNSIEPFRKDEVLHFIVDLKIR